MNSLKTRIMIAVLGAAVQPKVVAQTIATPIAFCLAINVGQIGVVGAINSQDRPSLGAMWRNDMRYIDADELYEIVTKKYADIVAGRYPYNIVAYDMAHLVKDAPTADVVEVVRCKDCKYWQDNNGGYPHEECPWGKGETPDQTDYCSYGERKE